MDYALGLCQPTNTAGAQFLFFRAGPNLDNRDIGCFKTKTRNDYMTLCQWEISHVWKEKPDKVYFNQVQEFSDM